MNINDMKLDEYETKEYNRGYEDAVAMTREAVDLIKNKIPFDQVKLKDKYDKSDGSLMYQLGQIDAITNLQKIIPFFGSNKNGK